MILALLLALLGGAPSFVTVSSPRGEVKLAVQRDALGTPRIAGPALAAALGTPLTRAGSWAELQPAGQPIRFLVGAPIYWYNGRIEPLAASAELARDTLYLPLQLVTDILPRLYGERFRYDMAGARLVETTKPVAAALVPRAGKGGSRAARGAAGLRRPHLVTVDAGHGGADPGNPGMFFPRGLREKDITLQVARRLREELERRGLQVRMTRDTDTLIALGDRGSYCSDACDLFVSLHVNSLPRRSGYTTVRGFETYFLAEAKTEEAARVAKMENDAVRYEGARDEGEPLTGLDFIVKDLTMNEHLRESALIAELVQEKLGAVHSGPDRGVKQAGFMVLTTARRPAILVELGYSTNPDDSRQMTTSSGQRALAVAVADAVVEYLRRYEAKTDAP